MKPETDFRYGQAVQVHLVEFGRASGGVVHADEHSITVRSPDGQREKTYTWDQVAYIIRYDNDAEWAGDKPE